MKGFGIYVENKLLTPKDYKAMGVGIWLYLWLLDKMTSVNESGIGLVLGGKPVTYEMVQEELGMSQATYKRHVSILRMGGYAKTTQAPYGLIFRMIDTKKIFRKRSIKNDPSETDSSKMSPLASEESNLSPQSDSSKVSHQGVKNELSNKIRQLDKTKNISSNEDRPEAPEVFGNEDINDVMKFAQENSFGLQGSKGTERQFCYNLMRKKVKDKPIGPEGVKKLVSLAVKHCDAPYAPNINDFKNLFYHWMDLVTHVKKEFNKQKKGHDYDNDPRAGKTADVPSDA